MKTMLPLSPSARSTMYRNEASCGSGMMLGAKYRNWVSGITATVNRGLSPSGSHLPPPSVCGLMAASAGWESSSPPAPAPSAAAPAPARPAARRKDRRVPPGLSLSLHMCPRVP